MGIVLALALSLVHPAVEAQPHLLDAALQPPVTLAGSGGDAAEKGVLWRVLGVPAGAGVGLLVGSMVSSTITSSTNRSNDAFNVVIGLLGVGLGAAGGYVVGNVADEGDSLARVGIGTTCVLETGAAALLFLMILALSHGV